MPSAAAVLLLSLLLAPLPAAAEPAGGPAAAEAVARPSRIVSLNLCADELLLRLADRDSVASVTYLAADPRVSSVSTLAAGLHVNHGLAEEILPLRPDLVIAGRYTTRQAVAFLRRIGVPLVELDIPVSLDEVYDQIRLVAEAIGEPGKGEALAAGLRRSLAALPAPREGKAPLAAVYRPSGYAVGPGTLVDELLGLSGLRNLAAETPQDRHGPLPIELLVWRQPDLLVLNDQEETLPSLAQAVLDHPALARSFPGDRTVVVHPSTWTCGGPALAEAVATLQQATRGLQEARER